MNRRTSLRSSVLVLILAGTVLLLATVAHAADDSKDSADDGTASTDDAANDVTGGDNGGGDEDDAGGGPEISSRTEAPPRAEATTIPLDAAALEAETTTKEAIETSSEPATSAVETSPPPYEVPQYRLERPGNGETCILMVVDAVVVVTYENKSKESRTADSYMTRSEPRGYCGEDEANLIIEWKQFTVKWSFMKTPGGERWYVNLVELQYDKADKPFENAYKVDKVKLSTRQAHGPMLFPTPVGRSFHCQSEYTLNFAPDKGGISDTATLLLREFQMQPFMYKPNFGPAFECNPGGVPRMRDETAPIAVGSTLAVVVLLTVTGYGVYRYFKIKKRFLEWVRSGPLQSPRGSQAIQQLDA